MLLLRLFHRFLTIASTAPGPQTLDELGWCGQAVAAIASLTMSVRSH